MEWALSTMGKKWKARNFPQDSLPHKFMLDGSEWKDNPYPPPPKQGKGELIHDIAALDASACLPAFLMCRSQKREIRYFLDSGAPFGNYLSPGMWSWLKSQVNIQSSEVSVGALYSTERHMSEGRVKVHIAIPWDPQYMCKDDNVKISENDFLIFDFSAEVVHLPKGIDLILGKPITDQFTNHKDSRIQEILTRTPAQQFGRASRAAATYASQKLRTATLKDKTTLAGILGYIPEEDGLPDIPDIPEWETTDHAILTTDAENDPDPLLLDEETIPQDVHGSPWFAHKVKSLAKQYNCFSTKLRRKPANLTLYKMEVNNEDWQQPRNRGKSRNLSAAKEAELEKHLVKLTAAGAIERCNATHYSHPHLVPKGHSGSDEMRLTFDFRGLNSATKDGCAFPIPLVPDMIRKIADSNPKIFTKFDLTKGYWQVPLDESVRDYTAFPTKDGVYRWTRLPMGLKRATHYFQKGMREEVLDDQLRKIITIYLDDGLMTASSEEEMITHLELLFRQLNKAGVTLNPKKTQIGLKEVEFVGHTISSEGRTFSKEKLLKAVATEKPQFDTQLKSFVSMIGFFRPNFEHMSNRIAPLHKMLQGYNKHKPRRLEWTTETTAAYDDIVTQLNNLPTVFFLQKTGKVIVEVDACDYGI